MSLVDLAAHPVRVSAPAKQDLRLAVDVSDYSQLDLELSVHDDSGTTPAVRVLTGMRRDTEDGWAEVDSFVPAAAPSTSKKTFFPLLRYVRWEVTAGTPTFTLRGVGHRSRGFRPTDVRGCVLWLRSDLGVELDASGGVSSWSDRSGQGNDFSQGTAAARPSYNESDASFNGHPSFSFDGAADNLATSSFTSPGAVHAFWVLKCATASPAVSTETGLEHFGTAAFSTHYVWTDSKVYMGFATSSRRTVGVPTQDVSGTHVLEVVSTSDKYEVTIGGNQEYSSTAAFGWTSTATIGLSLSGSHFFKGELAELVIHDRELDEAERARMRRYLRARYACSA